MRFLKSIILVSELTGKIEKYVVPEEKKEAKRMTKHVKKNKPSINEKNFQKMISEITSSCDVRILVSAVILLHGNFRDNGLTIA